MSIFELSIKRPILITMGIAVLVLFGALSFTKIPVDFMPKIEAPLATVLTIYPGADPETVEKEVTKKIEDALSELAGVDKLQSVSAENVSQVVILFDFGEDPNQAVQAVRDKVSRLSSQFPKDAEAPSVEKLDLGAAPVLTLAISGPGRIDEVTKLAKDGVKAPLQSVPGVGSIDIVGGAEREIKVWADPMKLESAGLAVTDLIGALQANNLKFPGGTFKTEDAELTFKIDGEFTTVAQVGRLPIVDAGGRVVRVEDVARVEDGVEEARSSAVRDGEKTVMLLVRKQSGTNAVEVAHALKAKLASIEKGLPQGWSATIAVDGSLFTEDSFKSVWFDMALGCLLAVLVVLLFLRNGRATIVAAIAIPTSVVATLGFVRAMGFTFNMLTLIALTLAIGLIVDDAIVVIENTFRHLKEGVSKREAALDGVKEIAFAMLASTLSLVAVFLPGALASGIVGILLREFALTLVAAVCISLLVSFTLTPMLSSRLLGGAKDNWLFALVRRALSALEGVYRGIIGWALRRRWATIGIAIAVFATTIYMVRFVHSEFVPTFDPGTVSVTVTLPAGTALEKTERVAERIAEKAKSLGADVVSTVVKVGADVRKKQNVAELVVKLSDKKTREATYKDIVDRMRTLFADEREAVVSINPPDITGGGTSAMGGAAVQLNLRGDDLAELERISNAVMREMSGVPGLIDVASSYEGGKPEVRLVMARDRAASLGVVTAQIGQVGRAYVGGVEASKFRVGGDEYSIRVRLPAELRESATQFGGLKVRSATTGKLVDVANAASLETVSGPTQIDRQARRRQITVSANNTEVLPLGEAKKIVDVIAARVVPPGVTTDYGGDIEKMGKTTNEFTTVFIVAVLLIYIVLAAQFESLIQPFAVMTALPLSVIGALLAILVTGTNLSILTLMGMLMLMGLVAKNSILLVDYTNTLRRRGLSRTDALLKAGPTRLRPILMTTFAMVAAMIPVATSDSWGSEMRAPIAMPVIGGLLAGTLLTLVVVPVIYALLDDLGAFLSRAFMKRGAVVEAEVLS
ncbi:MAG: efflux RND transporter permease subunit [Deltaproteobacteria bacterium]|nr:efflux RND transporter permease subunit [Deltaproteobacteria bacterium]